MDRPTTCGWTRICTIACPCARPTNSSMGTMQDIHFMTVIADYLLATCLARGPQSGGVSSASPTNSSMGTMQDIQFMTVIADYLLATCLARGPQSGGVSSASPTNSSMGTMQDI